MNGVDLDLCDPLDPDCSLSGNGGLLPFEPPGTEPVGIPSKFCRSDSQPNLFTFWPINRDCPEGFHPTTYGSSRICPEPGCQLGVVGGYCTEFWILLGVAAFILWRGVS